MIMYMYVYDISFVYSNYMEQVYDGLTSESNQIKSNQNHNE